MASTMIYPWQQTLWHRICQQWQQQRLPHAWLLHGAQGLGKMAFVSHFSKALLCENSNKNCHPCEHCHACTLFDANNHPDFTLYQTDEKNKTITIDKVRQLINTVQLTPRYGRYQIIVLAPAETMNIAASNALLKVLEEPPAQTLFFLIAQQPQRLPLTIRSRCQAWSFDRCELKLKQQWLQQQMPQLDMDTLLQLSNQPLLAENQWQQMEQQQQIINDWQKTQTGQQNIVTTANTWAKLEHNQLFIWLYQTTRQLIKTRLIQSPNHRLQALSNSMQKLSNQQLFLLLDSITHHQQLCNQHQLKPQSCFESILLTTQ